MFGRTVKKHLFEASGKDHVIINSQKWVRTFCAVVAMFALLFVTGRGNAQSGSFSIPTSINAGNVNVGSTGSTLTFTFVFGGTGGGTLGAVSVLTDGAPSLDFTVTTGASSCTAGTTYAANSSCNVYVTFTPKLSGYRRGAVVLTTTTNGTPFGAQYFYGIGVGPQAVIFPGTLSSIFSTTSSPALDQPYGAAVDATGNVYVADHGTRSIYKLTYSGGTYTPSQIATLSSSSSPESVAVDAAGNVYALTTVKVNTSTLGSVVKLTPNSTGTVYTSTAITNNLSALLPSRILSGIAVDGSGNIFVADPSQGNIYELVASQTINQYVAKTILSGQGAVQGLAADTVGNLYFVAAQTLYKATSTGGVYTASAIETGYPSEPYGVAVDNFGDVYVTDAYNDLVVEEEPLSGGSYQAITLMDGNVDVYLSSPYGVAVDGQGNVYVANEGTQEVLKLDVADTQSYTFASTAASYTSADSPYAFTLFNLGNAALNFAIPTTAGTYNPSISNSSFVLGTGSGDCTVTAYGASSGGTVAAGTYCELPVSFVPPSAGTFTGTLVLTDNNLNVTNAQQTIDLNGTGTAVTTTWAPPASITYGTDLTGVLTASVNAGASGSWSYTIPGIGVVLPGTILPAGVYQIDAIFTPNSTGKPIKLSTRLIVSRATLVVLPDDKSVTYGSQVPTYTYSLTGFMNGDTSAVVTGGPTVYATATSRATSTYGVVVLTSNVGTYTIKSTWGSLSAKNYTFSFGTANLSISQSPTYLTVKANSLKMTHGGTVPTLTYSISGLLNWDTQATQLSGAPSLSTTATSSSPVGSYPITISAGTLTQKYGNYAGINYVSGTLTVQ